MSLTWTTLALCPFGADLHCARVQARPGGVRVDEAVIPNFLATPDADARRALASICPGGRMPTRLVLVCPVEWCAARPVALTTRQWAGARAEVVRSIEQMLPLDADDALVGLVDMRADEAAPGAPSAPVGSCLVGVRASVVRRWTDAIERFAGRRVDLVLSPHMAALGLGLQREQEASVIEPGPGAGAIRLRRGRIVGVMQQPGAGPRLALPGEVEGEVDGAAALTPGDMAVAGALAERVAPEDFRPLVGRTRSTAWRWAGPGVAATLAAACVAGAFVLADARRAEAIDTLRAERAALLDRFEESRRLGERAERLTGLLEVGVGAATDAWRSPMPVLRDIAQAVEPPAFLYRIDIQPRSATVVGEGAEVLRVLQRLEGSPTLRAAALTDTLLPSPSDETLDVFSIRAERDAGEGAP